MRFLPVLLIALLIGSRAIATAIIDYAWWTEVNQVPAWINLMLYGFAPMAIASIVAGAVLWMAFARGLKFGGAGLRHYPLLARYSPLAALFAGFLIAAVTVDQWDIMRYIGGRELASDPKAWHDPVFGHALSFYLFELPFYRVVHSFVLGLSIVTIAAYWIAARSAQLRNRFEQMRFQTPEELVSFGLEGALESSFLRMGAAIFFLSLSVRFYLGRYDLLLSNHGFMTGVDWTDETIRLPLLWALTIACVLGAVLMSVGRLKTALAAVAVPMIALVAVPAIIAAVYVRPNEINIEKPYIQRHIEATRSAFGLSARLSEAEFNIAPSARIDVAANKTQLDNVRLWDWRAFHDTVTQIQSLRPYYVFDDTDVDRYTIDGQLRQVMVTPRELDIRQLPDARTRWINPHFIYTHGYGLVMAEANRITSDGLPSLLVQDAPPKIRGTSINLTRPEIYYGESTHEPVIVRSQQAEFSYPRGNDSVFTRYEGKGGFPIASFGMRVAAAIRDGDYNLLLTNLITPDSRMMIRRRVVERVDEMAGFIHWDADPYLVVDDGGRLVWTLDGYTTSDSHPYSQHLSLGRGSRINYMRNSVKATVDAYDGTVHIYVFDAADPIIRAYQRLFPGLLEAASRMPASIRAHARYPEYFFSVQAQIYRTYHMRDPQAFYNKEDMWDVARNMSTGKQNRGRDLEPYYVLANLPGESKPEFLLTLPFTPRGKDNLAGLMVARCDGESLGELRVLQLSRQALIFGPMQIEARIDQDPDISKDLTLWSQKGSEVLRGQMLVFPVGDTFIYVEPIYIQAAQARMPQLQKVVVAMGNELIYRNTYDEAIAALAARSAGGPLPPPSPTAPQTPGQPAAQPAAPAPAAADQRINEIRNRLRRYRDLWSQGKYAEAGQELEAIESLAR